MKSFFSGRNLFVCKSATDGFDVVFQIFSKKKTQMLLAVTAVLSALCGSVASADMLRADWMAGKRGMMVHWLFAEAGQIDYYANAFDINKFMADFDAAKSDYLIFTVGQNAGVYASPNTQSEVRCAPREDAGR